MVEGHRCPQECCGHAKMYLEKGESKCILRIWCAYLFSLWLCSLRKEMEDYQSLVRTAYMNQMVFKFLGWNTWCHYPKERI